MIEIPEHHVRVARSAHGGRHGFGGGPGGFEGGPGFGGGIFFIEINYSNTSNTQPSPMNYRIW